MSSNPSIKHFFLKESISNLVTLFPNLISCFWRSTSTSSFLLEYSDKEATKVYTNRLRKNKLLFPNDLWGELEYETSGTAE